MADRSFDLVLCSHLRFLYDHRLDLAFHTAALLEMLRVGLEARIFPLLDLSGKPSALVAPVAERLRGIGFRVSLEKVGYEFQKGGNHMLKITHPDQVGVSLMRPPKSKAAPSSRTA